MHSEATLYQGEEWLVSEITIYQGDRMPVIVKRSLQNKKKPSGLWQDTETSSNATVYEIYPSMKDATKEVVLPSGYKIKSYSEPTVQDRLEFEEIFSKTFETYPQEKRGRVEIIVENTMRDLTPIEIERAKGIDHREVSRELKDFAHRAKKINES